MNKINKALHGVINPGGCWHELPNLNIDHTKDKTCSYPCLKCGKIFNQDEFLKFLIHGNPDYFSKEGFWALKDWLKENNLTDKFMFSCGVKGIRVWDIFDYKIFAKNSYDFLAAEGIIKGDG